MTLFLRLQTPFSNNRITLNCNYNFRNHLGKTAQINEDKNRKTMRESVTNQREGHRIYVINNVVFSLLEI